MLYDTIIIGSGPAGLTAALYAARAQISTLIIEKEVTGGQVAITHEVENYPGGMAGETGPELIERMEKQARSFGAEFVRDSVTALELEGSEKQVVCKKQTYRAKTVILATGGSPRRIGCPGEREFTGRGVSYCATCDGFFFKDLEIFAIGGGDTAVEESIFLTKFAKKVTIVHRRDKLRAVGLSVQKANDNPKIEYLWDTVVEEIRGDDEVSSIIFKNIKTNETTEYKADPTDKTFGIFVFVGFEPVNEIFTKQLTTDESGYVLTDADMRTNIPGVFAAGDVRQKNLRQIVTATADGAIAAMQAEKYIHNH